MIIIYSKETCPQCRYAKALLEDWGIEYTEIKIDIDDIARNFLIGEGHRSVPQIYLGESLMVENGYAGLRTMTAEKIKTKVEIYESRKR